MADTKKVKRVVEHPKLYLAVGGKLQHVPPGTEVTVTTEQADSLGDKLSDPSKTKKVEVDDKKANKQADALEKKAAELAAVAEKTKDAKDIKAANEAAQKAADARAQIK